MDKEFEEWYENNECYDAIAAEKAWNASKQHWLDKCGEMVKGRFADSDVIVKAIKELKK